MEMNLSTIRKESPEVGMVEFTIRKVSGFFGPYKDVVMSYKKNDRKVTRTFIMDTDGRIKLKKACEKLLITADNVLARVY